MRLLKKLTPLQSTLMIKDAILKTFFLPLTGILLPLLTGLYIYSQHSTSEVILSNILFLVFSFFIWQSTISLTAYLRQLPSAKKNILNRLLMQGMGISISAFLASGLFALLWQKLFNGSFQKQQVMSFSLTYTGAAMVIGLVYEILFLHKEVELDSKIVDQLDLERQYAEMHVLKNELDPHFIFNSLTTLSHLISHDSEKAHLFNNKLAQAYKYLLLNKDRELITLEEELRFIEDYFFLLQIRYDHKLQLEINLNGNDAHKTMILPCALQTLVENAIKHNSFTDKNPLQIQITMQKNHLQVSNNISNSSYLVPSTHVGLKNLRTRYKLTCQREIIISRTKEAFLVKLPLIKPTHV